MKTFDLAMQQYHKKNTLKRRRLEKKIIFNRRVQRISDYISKEIAKSFALKFVTRYGIIHSYINRTRVGKSDINTS